MGVPRAAGTGQPAPPSLALQGYGSLAAISENRRRRFGERQGGFVWTAYGFGRTDGIGVRGSRGNASSGEP
ncbi:hypothetical protein D7X33_05615 [Butyricicoccus sp. 1XD8-22]|nr:hypothetical protein D7X33_05615 [Butyricicoccus sp. 1XD8-22]